MKETLVLILFNKDHALISQSIKCLLRKIFIMIYPLRIALFFAAVLLFNGCIVQFIPETNETQELLVVEGLITDQPGVNIIKLSRSLPLGGKIEAKPLSGFSLNISDDLGHIYYLHENSPGSYETNPADFQGQVGRIYTLHINSNEASNNLSYTSSSVEMLPVPPIDHIYYEKKNIADEEGRNAVCGRMSDLSEYRRSAKYL